MSVFRMLISSTENPDKKLFIIFPTTADIFKNVLNNLGLEDNAPPEKYCLSDFESFGVYYEQIGKIVDKNANINELNFLAQAVDELNKDKKFVFQAAVEAGEHTQNTADLINLALNMNCYEVVDEIYDYEDAGRYLMQQQTLDGRTLNFLEDYIDYEKFGEEYSKEHHCYLLENEAFLDGDKKPFFREYDGNVLNIPAESRITPIETEPAYFDEKFDASKRLAFELDSFFRDFDRNYTKTYSDETQAQIFLSDYIMNGETDFIKKELAGLKIDRNDDLPDRLNKFEQKYIKSAEITDKKPSVREQLKNNVKELGDKSIPKPTHKSPPEL